MTRTRAAVGPVLAVIGVLALVVLAWIRLLGDHPFGLPVILAAVVALLAVAAAVFALGVRRSQSRHRAVESQRPGWRLHEVWADAGLGSQLVRQGVWERGLVPGCGSRLTLAWSTAGIELWRGGHVVVVLAWQEVASLSPGVGRPGSIARPALVIHTLAGAALVLIPQSRAHGGVLPADRACIAELLTDLRSMRDEHERS